MNYHFEREDEDRNHSIFYVKILYYDNLCTDYTL
jgi:hypothetical protein